MGINKILLVEDEKEILQLIARFLKSNANNHVLTATKGKDAIDIISKERPNLVFLDIQLEDDVSGMDVLKEAVRISPQTKVVMVSGYQEEYKKMAEDLGAFKFLNKPINVADLINVLAEI